MSVVETPAAPIRERRTRRPDWLTDAFLVLSTVFAVWSIGLIALTLLAIVEPARYDEDEIALLKVVGATGVAVMAIAQLGTMESAMGHLPRLGLRIGTLVRAHRRNGRIAIALAAVVAYFCMTVAGAPEDPGEDGFIHAVFGSTAFLAIAIKLALIRFRPRVAYDAAPWLGRYAAAAFVMVWISSALEYIVDEL